jgi:DNA-binding NarL/FixJ family response regulator
MNLVDGSAKIADIGVTGMVMKRILLVDDHPLLLDGLARLVTTVAGHTVCAMAADVNQALTLVESEMPDLIITDLTMPGRNGMELIKDLGATHPEIPIIVYSMHDELMYAERALRAGARGYVMKDRPPDRIVEAIRVVLGGGVFASKSVTNHLLQTLNPLRNHLQPSFPLERLTDREMEVFELIGQAKSNHEIASRLHISPRTLDAHRTHIRVKLGLTDGNDLTRYAIHWNEVGSIQR